MAAAGRSSSATRSAAVEVIHTLFGPSDEPDVPDASHDPAAKPRRSLIDLDATFLPVAQMRQISRVTQLEGQGITGELDVEAGHWVYAQHFPGEPLFPGSLMIEAAAQLVALWAWAQGQRGRLRLVRTRADFHHPVGPTSQRLRLHAEVRRKTHFNFGTIGIWVGGTQVATLEAVLAVLPPAAGTPPFSDQPTPNAGTSHNA